MSEITQQEFTSLLVNPQYTEQLTEIADYSERNIGLGARMLVTKDGSEAPLIISPVEVPDDRIRSSALSTERPYMGLYVAGSYNRFPNSRGRAPVVAHLDLDIFHNNLSNGLPRRLIGGLVTPDDATLYFRHREHFRWAFGEELKRLKDIGEAPDVNEAARRLTAAGLYCYIRQREGLPEHRIDIDQPFRSPSNLFRR